jgi:hypothetical protein
LKGEGLVAPLATIPNDIVKHSVKHKLDFDELKVI